MNTTRLYELCVSSEPISEKSIEVEGVHACHICGALMCFLWWNRAISHLQHRDPLLLDILPFSFTEIHLDSLDRICVGLGTCFEWNNPLFTFFVCYDIEGVSISVYFLQRVESTLGFGIELHLYNSSFRSSNLIGRVVFQECWCNSPTATKSDFSLFASLCLF